MAITTHDEPANLSGRRRALLQVALTVVMLTALSLVYAYTARTPLHDSHYSMLLSEQLWRHGSFQLDDYFHDPAKHWDSPLAAQLSATNLPYLVYRYDGHIYYGYLPGSSVLSIPFVAVLNQFGISAASPTRGYSVDGETRIERIVAPIIAAVTVYVLFLIGRLFLGPLQAALAAGVAAFGTSLWSTSAQALWSHTWLGLLVSLAILLVLRAELEGRSLRPVLLGTLLAWAFFVRPTAVVSSLLLATYVVLRHPRQAIRVCTAGVVWGFAFVTFSLSTAGALLPPYLSAHSTELSFQALARNAAYVMVSPGRGLLVYSPVLLAIPLALVLHRRAIPSIRQLLLGLCGIAGHILLVATWPMWWGGFCYGARLMTDALPWIFLVAVLAWSAANHASTRARMLWKVALVVLSLASVAIQSRGVLSTAPWEWQWTPRNIHEDASRLLDWSDPPFLARMLPE